ncbi:MAG: hypothetical protein GXO91_00920 [FCB group bacterium]|nr:hypothetical protein [FCB group bacterium]
MISTVLLRAQEWQLLSSDISENINAVDFITESEGFVVGEGGLLYATNDGGDSWVQQDSGTNTDLYDVSCISDSVVIAVGGGGLIIRTVNGGNTWTNVPTPTGLTWDLNSVSIDPAGNGIIGGAAQTILTTGDLGVNWEIVQTDMMGGSFPGAQMVDENLGFLYGQNSIFAPLIARTTDGGASWNFVTFYLVEGQVGYEGKLYDGYFFDETHGFTAARRWDGWGCISVTENFADWTTLHFSGTPLKAVDFLDENQGYVAGDSGTLKYTDDTGVTWLAEDSGVTTNLRGLSCVAGSRCYAVGENGTIIRKILIPQGILGDVNGDGALDILDIVRIVNIILLLPPEPTDYELWAGDLNQDDQINVLDVISLLNLILEA